MKKALAVLSILIFAFTISCKKELSKVQKEDLIIEKLIESSELFNKKEYSKSLKVCKEILSLDSNNTLAMKKIGSIYYMNNFPEKAKEIWEKVLKNNPNDQEVKKGLESLKKQSKTELDIKEIK
ncbi:MAG: hypothetical protein COS68_03920 [Elusimicrobia bacterium CG06_land_8_20_14_3_00_38_11]|nr:MAG: hypothetical protein COS68_03920 [Elusimicrobia bacterium CG06_land_8_20_14_3_00_38_11]